MCYRFHDYPPTPAARTLDPWQGARCSYRDGAARRGGAPPAPPRSRAPPRRPRPLHSPHLLVFVDDVSGDLFADDLPEDGVPARTRRLRLADLVSHGGSSGAAPAGPQPRLPPRPRPPRRSLVQHPHPPG